MATVGNEGDVGDRVSSLLVQGSEKRLEPSYNYDVLTLGVQMWLVTERHSAERRLHLIRTRKSDGPRPLWDEGGVYKK